MKSSGSNIPGMRKKGRPRKAAAPAAALPEKKRRRIRMKKPADAIRLLNKVINSLLNDEMDVDKARALVYASSTIAKCFELNDIEARLMELEDRLVNGGKGR